MRHRSISGTVALALACAAAVAGCYSDAPEDEALPQFAAGGRADDPGGGTSLSATSAAAAPVCGAGGEATVAVSGTVTTTGAVSPTAITVAIDGGAPAPYGTIAETAYVHDGRIKTAGYALDLRLANGEHTVVVCFAQPGAGGTPRMSACAAPVIVTVACRAAACATARVFGDLASNPSLCRGNGPPHIPVHVNGDFGDAPALAIHGPGAFRHDATLRLADECTYQYNWDTATNGGAGEYAFVITGNGRRLEHVAALHCP